MNVVFFGIPSGLSAILPRCDLAHATAELAVIQKESTIADDRDRAHAGSSLVDLA